MAAISNTELATRALREMSIFPAGETPEADDLATAVTVLSSVLAEMRRRDIAIWFDDEVQEYAADAVVAIVKDRLADEYRADQRTEAMKRIDRMRLMDDVKDMTTELHLETRPSYSEFE